MMALSISSTVVTSKSKNFKNNDVCSSIMTASSISLKTLIATSSTSIIYSK